MTGLARRSMKSGSACKGAGVGAGPPLEFAQLTVSQGAVVQAVAACSPA